MLAPMVFDPTKVPGGDVARWGEDCKARAVAALGEGDWRGVYDWTKSWIGWGGGAWLPDTWLLYATSALLKREPKNAVHSLDLGLGIWIEGPADRALMTWCRGVLVWKVLNDPKTAVIDLSAAALQLPAWLEPGRAALLKRCRDDAAASRKRVPSVTPRPELARPAWAQVSVSPAVGGHPDGVSPQVWAAVAPHFSAA